MTAAEADPAPQALSGNVTSGPLEWIPSMPTLPPDSSSDSSIQHHRHDSSNSSGSGCFGSDVMMIDESQISAWNADEQVLPDNLGPFAHSGNLTGCSHTGGDDEAVHQQASAADATTPMNRISSPITAPSLSGSPRPQPSMAIDRILEKSRVETQIPVVLTLCHMPEGIKRIHFPPSSISKSKLLSRPPPSKSPDMLELHVALVCTSAMSDLSKRKEALDREASRQHHMQGLHSREETKNPLDGGEVNSCSKCIKRERKRANRKKVKNVEEEEAWQRDEANRIIVFNSPEVIDLAGLATAHSTAQTLEVTGTIQPHHRVIPAISTSVGINLAMRITCYCRHHEEKAGFQCV